MCAWGGPFYDVADEPPLAPKPIAVDALEQEGAVRSDSSRDMHTDCSTLCDTRMA